MTLFHDPLRQVSYLKQCLSSDKKPLAIFLGAGCPLAIDDGQGQPLISDIAGITRLVIAEFSTSSPFQTVVGHLEADGVELNIEKLLSHIRALKSVAGNSEVRGITAVDLDSLDESICTAIQNIVRKELPDGSTPYHWLASWISGRNRQDSIELFTTNYDLLIEQALEERNVPYFDGFIGGRKPSFDLQGIEDDIISPRWARLFKIHGSINWYYSANRGVYRSHLDESKATRVIYPSHLKYAESRRMPYLAMMDRLRYFLKKPHSMLALIGYSFGDEHINEVIMQGLQSNPTAIVFGLLYSDLENHPKATGLARFQSNLSILAKDSAIIGNIRAEWNQIDEPQNKDEDISWIDWIEEQSADHSTIYKSKFNLGDFLTFGHFLRHLSGDSSNSQVNQNEA